jgi:hypothetical protein
MNRQTCLRQYRRQISALIDLLCVKELYMCHHAIQSFCLKGSMHTMSLGSFYARKELFTLISGGNR